MVGEPPITIAEYTKSVFSASSERVDLSVNSGRRVGAMAVMKEITLSSGAAQTSIFRMNEPISFTVRFEAKKKDSAMLWSDSEDRARLPRFSRERPVL